MTVATVSDKPPLLDTPGDRVLARYYRSVFGWPVAADSAGVWLRIGDVVDVLVIRGQLAGRVNSILVPSFLGAPIIEVYGRHSFWVFLTQPRTPLRRSTWAELGRLGITWREPGSSMRLPSPGGRATSLRWLKCPTRGARLPPWTAVVGSARSASNQAGTG